MTKIRTVASLKLTKPILLGLSLSLGFFSTSPTAAGAEIESFLDEAIYSSASGTLDLNIDPPSLQATMASNATLEQTLTLTAIDGPIDWNLETSGASDMVEDGSFEFGNLGNPYWSGFSSPFGDSPSICSQLACGYDLASEGEWYLWLGGFAGSMSASAEQQLTIEVAAWADLRFNLLMGTPDPGPLAVAMQVYIDDTVVATFTANDLPDYGSYTPVVIDVSEFADGESHVLQFFYLNASDELFNMFIDEVSLLSRPLPDAPVCRSASDIPWLNADPLSGTLSSDQVEVNVVFDSTGLDLGVYSDILCVTSSGADVAIQAVPVTMNVNVSGISAIDIQPSSMESTLPADSTEIQTLNLEATESTLAWNVETDGGVESVFDGSFELGYQTNPYWSAFADINGELLPICSEATCGPRLASEGNWYLWLGGGAFISSWAEQEFMIPVNAVANLRFNMRMGMMAHDFPLATMTISIDGTPLATYTEADLDDFSDGHTPVIIDVSSYADGENHALRFDFSNHRFYNFNIFIDEVSLISEPRLDAVECKGVAAIPWLRIDPMAGILPPGNVDLEVTFDSTGLAPGVYTENLCVTIDDPNNPTVAVPLTMTVTPSLIFFRDRFEDGSAK